MWFSGQPVFWLPHGLLPHALEWLIAFPRAPTGSVSPASWQLACSVTLGLLVEGVTALVKTSGDGRGKPPVGSVASPDRYLGLANHA